MLQRLSDHIRACYERATHAEELAAQSEPALKAYHLDMAKRWTFLAHSYEFNDNLERFLLELDRNMPAQRAGWRPIATAPYDHDLRLAVVAADGVAHELAFPARRVLRGWINAESRKPIMIDPSHWREWIEES